MTHFVNPSELGAKDLVAHIVELTDGGADYSFECVGNTKLMRQALECCPSRLGQVGDHRRRRRGPGDLRRGRSSSSPAGSGWARRSAAPRAGATCRRSSTGTWTARSTSTRSITHVMPVEKINDAFHLMHEGKSIRSVVTF